MMLMCSFDILSLELLMLLLLLAAGGGGVVIVAGIVHTLTHDVRIVA